MTIALARFCSAANSPSIARAAEICVPFNKASPSLASRVSGLNPADCSACAAGRRPPLKKTSPSPISGRDRCARGARSPEAPTDPFSGITGKIFSDSIEIKCSITCGRTPEYPRAKLKSFRIIASRTICGASGSPTPAACERMRLCCSVERSATSTWVFASLPKPVLMP